MVNAFFFSGRAISIVATPFRTAVLRVFMPGRLRSGGIAA
jgi:hypothetical protein